MILKNADDTDPGALERALVAKKEQKGTERRRGNHKKEPATAAKSDPIAGTIKKLYGSGWF